MHLFQKPKSNLSLCLCTITFALIGCSSSSNSTNNSNLADAEGSDAIIDASIGDSDGEFDCPVGSLYDAEEDVCYIDCDGLTDEQCDDLDIEVFGDFDEFIDDEFAGPGSDNQDMMSTERTIAQYTIDSDLNLSSIENEQPESDNQFRQIWDSARKILPKKVIAETLSEYQVSTDGIDNTLAFVITDENKPGKWIIGFDNADYIDGKDAEFVHTTVHEFGHIVFLREGQVEMTELDNCPNYAIMEGCTATNSFINKFYQQFWTAIVDEHQTAAEFGEDSQALFDFYEKHQDQFISDYAATNPVEDAAETFTHFVLSSKPKQDGPVHQQKILFLYQFSELVKLRNIIRGKLEAIR